MNVPHWKACEIVARQFTRAELWVAASGTGTLWQNWSKTRLADRILRHPAATDRLGISPQIATGPTFAYVEASLQRS